MWFFKPKFRTGLLPDNRIPEEREKDYLTVEVLKSQPLEWVDFDVWMQREENKKMLQELPVYDQNGASSCVSHSIALIATINNWKEEKRAVSFAARGIYARRKNKPDKGMIFYDAAELFKKYGTIFESVLPSEKLNEEQMNKLDDYLPSYDAVGKVYAPKNYFWTGNFQDVVQVISRSIPVQIGVRFANGEWDKDVPQISKEAKNYSDLPYRHSVVVLPNAYFKYQNKLAVLIQDSWGYRGVNGRRILTEDWFVNLRFMGGLWYEDINNLEIFNIEMEIKKPRYVFNHPMKLGDRGQDITMLQVCLATIKDEEGYLFPLWEGTTPTGYFGGMTRKAVIKYQKLRNITPQSGYVGPKTLEALNKDFS